MKPIGLILAAALAIRLAAAWYNNTPMAEDDYANIMDPALHALQTGSQPETVEYRLDIFARIFHAFMKPFHAAGIRDNRVLISFGFSAVALLSLSFVLGMHRWEQVSFGPGKRRLLLFSAFYFLVPLLATRTFLEFLVLNTIPWAYFFRHKMSENGDSALPPFLSALFFGLSTIIRFQVAILAVVALVEIILALARRRVNLRQALFFAAGGLFSLILLGLLDVVSGRKIFSTLMNYFALNYTSNVASEQYGSAPWYSYIGVLLAVMIPPVSLLLLPSFFRGARRYTHEAVALLCFVLLHSLIANKLERFIVPVVPLFVFLSFAGLDVSPGRMAGRALKIFSVINLVLLPFTVFTRSQANIIDAAEYLREKNLPVYFRGIDLWKQGYLGYDKPMPSDWDPGRKITGKGEFLLLNLGELREAEKKEISGRGRCQLEKKFSPAWLESVVNRLNPGPNRRRGTTFLYRCQPET